MRTEIPSYERIAVCAYKAPFDADGVAVLPTEWDDDNDE